MLLAETHFRNINLEQWAFFPRVLLDTFTSDINLLGKHVKLTKDMGGGGGGGFLVCEDFGRVLDHSFRIPRLRFFVCVCEVEISSPTLIPLIMLRSVHGGSAS